MNDQVLVVQFVHPGFEYTSSRYVGPKKQRSGVMAWKEGRAIHNRKFMWIKGSAVEPSADQEWKDVPLTFWGEWEGPSVYWKLGSADKTLASIVHSPFRPSDVPTRSVQNTDPMVFGDKFIYSNCRQGRYEVLRSLPPGSVILFGRLGDPTTNPSFSLDTCFVVDRVQQLPTIPFDPRTYGEDLVEDAALCALYTEGFQTEIGVHTGRSRDQGEIFSFFPAKVSEDRPELFARPELKPRGALVDVISPPTQNVKITRDVSLSERDAIWSEVAMQVFRQGCVLGHYAVAPPLLSDAEAIEYATRPPTPIGA